MNQIVEEMKKTGTFYVATDDNGIPHVRPFSSITEFEGTPYLCTNNTKKVFAQILKKSDVEISGMEKDGTWIRVTGQLVSDNRSDAQAAMLADPTGPSNLYHLGDGLFEVFRLENAVCTKYSFTSDPVIIK
jgi:uncharacterized pyridoxamine 5'-phosphate oxidase family protein